MIPLNPHNLLKTSSKEEDIYEGEIKNGKYHGKGILCREDYSGGKLDIYTQEGIFEYGSLIEGTIKNTKGKIVKTVKAADVKKILPYNRK